MINCNEWLQQTLLLLKQIIKSFDLYNNDNNDNNKFIYVITSNLSSRRDDKEVSFNYTIGDNVFCSIKSQKIYM